MERMIQDAHEMHPTVQAIERLLAGETAEIQDPAYRLGAVVWRNIDLANLQPTMRGGDRQDAPGGEDEDVAVGEEYKISPRVSAYLEFVVSAAFERQLDTPNWLLNTSRIELRLNKYGAVLPEDMRGNIPDPMSQTKIIIAPDSECQTDFEPREQPYAASYPDGARLDTKNTETVIGILALIADWNQSALNES